MLLSSLVPLALLGVAAAHPGHNVREEALERRQFLDSTKRSDLSHCAAKLKARGVSERNVARRSATLEKARQKRGLNKRSSCSKRDTADVLATSHNSTGLGYTTATDAATLFSGNNSCILGPDVTQGPYYVGGEYIRDNIAEDQAGLATYLDYQIIDVDTCEPVPSVYVEIWHCNSTGVYSGVVASGNGVESDESNIDNTFHRGIQLTDSDGVAQFQSTFPGHYTGRTTHVHVMVHTNAHVYENGTLGNEVSASHVGQAFFDQALIYAVEATETYNTNTQELTLNADDSILAEEADTIDPMMEYTLLGPKIEDGVFAWIAFGINVTESQSVTPAAFLYEDGGVTNENSGAGGPGGGGAGGPPDMSMSGSAAPMPTA